jgi:hypothetical protein
MKNRYVLLAPWLFVIGCAVPPDDAQESSSQADDAVSQPAAPAGAATGQPRADSVQSLTGASPDSAIATICSWNADTVAVFVPGGVLFPTTPGVFAELIPTGGLLFDAGGSLQCNWSNGLSTNLTLQGSDGNFVFYNHSNGKTWGAHTRSVDNPNGPGVTAAFQTDANLVVRNAASKAIWASNTHTFPQAVLAFQSDGNLVIYSQFNQASGSVGIALWATGTN